MLYALYSVTQNFKKKLFVHQFRAINHFNIENLDIIIIFKLKYLHQKIFYYCIRHCSFSSFVESLVSLEKSWWLATLLNKILYIEHFSIKNYFKINLFNFSYLMVQYHNHLTILQLFFIFSSLACFLSSHWSSICNIYLLFLLYIGSSKVNRIFIISGSSYCSVNSISIGPFFSLSFPPIHYYIWLKFFSTGFVLFSKIWIKYKVLVCLLLCFEIRYFWCDFFT